MESSGEVAVDALARSRARLVVRQVLSPVAVVARALSALSRGAEESEALSADRLVVLERGLVAVDPQCVNAVVSVTDGQTELLLTSGHAVEVAWTVEHVLRILRGEPLEDVAAPEGAETHEDQVSAERARKQGWSREDG
jgi:hypothetical protein